MRVEIEYVMDGPEIVVLVSRQERRRLTTLIGDAGKRLKELAWSSDLLLGDMSDEQKELIGQIAYATEQIDSDDALRVEFKGKIETMAYDVSEPRMSLREELWKRLGWDSEDEEELTEEERARRDAKGPAIAYELMKPLTAPSAAEDRNPLRPDPLRLEFVEELHHVCWRALNYRMSARRRFFTPSSSANSAAAPSGPRTSAATKGSTSGGTSDAGGPAT